jgi:hypothetical protein
MHESFKQVLQGKMFPSLLSHQIHPMVSFENTNLNFLRDEILTLDFKMLQEDQETERERERTNEDLAYK